jgi:hypothetical protein
MKIFTKLDFNIWHDICIGHFAKQSTIFKRKMENRYGFEFGENSSEFIPNLVQTTITTLINLRLHGLTAGCYNL